MGRSKMSSEQAVEEQVKVVTDPAPDPKEQIEIDAEGIVKDALDKAREVEGQQPEQEEEPEQKQAEEKQDFDPKKHVDFNDEQQAKFNHVYKQLKNSDTRNQMLTDMLQEQQKQLDDLRNSVGDVQNRFDQTDSAEAEKVILNKIMEANEEGNTEDLVNGINELTKFRTENAIQSLKQTEQQPEQISQSDQEMASVVMNYMAETNTDGTFKRPWLQEGSDDFDNSVQRLALHAFRLQQENPNDPDILTKSLQALDKEMESAEPKRKQNTNKNTRIPDPMSGGDLTGRTGQSKIKLSREQMEIINKLNQHSKVKINPKNYWEQTQRG